VAALVRPLAIADAGRLHVPAIVMLASLGLAIALGWRGQLSRAAGVGLLAGYPVFVAVAVLVR
jgi:Ca2+/Na+ antiporter